MLAGYEDLIHHSDGSSGKLSGGFGEHASNYDAEIAETSHLVYTVSYLNVSRTQLTEIGKQTLKTNGFGVINCCDVYLLLSNPHLWYLPRPARDPCDARCHLSLTQRASGDCGGGNCCSARCVCLVSCGLCPSL